MTRMFSVLSLVAALAIGGYLFAAQAGQRATETKQQTQAVDQAQQAASTANLASAAIALQAQQAETGSYTGTDLSGVGGVALVRADASTYCIQAGTGTAVSHQAGPGTAVVAGPC